ncbi:winged helix-turn-helix domain-containing protein [Dokdonella sp.]|uniref:protein kinase domain-containing protein n=1 Tax=Dokdonella sp. TaxID=2291710 RepID=UPI0026252F57|nr:winged helix-turn-helix domain-containing protein [Dokdonella sp.]
MLWRFGPAEFDEAAFVLRVGGVECELQTRPLQVLQLLLRHAGEVVTREEILDAVWGHRHITDSTINSLVSRLRRALGDEEFRVIGNVARVGYRLGVPVHAEPVAGFSPGASPLEAGSAVPHRADFVLAEPLGNGGDVEVWLARHRHTREPRVFKFAFDGPRLSSLKREVTLARVLLQTLGDRPDFVRPVDWNFESLPFSIELPHAGRNLIEWAQAHGGLGAVPLERRIALLADIAETVAAAHGAGVLHKDLKPANVLMDEASPRPRVVDFGCGGLLDPERLAELEVTRMGFTREDAGTSAAAGTALYLAPEVLAGQAPTAQADVYALGVMLYQFCIGQLQAPITPGWQGRVDDELLREDIEAAAHGDLARRLGSAAELAHRLRSLPQRREAIDDERALRERAHALQRTLETQRARRPWVVATIALLASGLVASTALLLFAQDQREEALRQQSIAEATRRFLRDDIMRATSPDQRSSTREPSLIDAIRAAADKVGQRFAGQPRLEAEVRGELGSLYNQTTEYPLAVVQFRRALDLLEHDPRASARSLALTRYRLAQALIGQYEHTQARTVLDAATVPPGADAEVAFARDLAWGDYLYRTGESALALPYRESAVENLRRLDAGDTLAISLARIQLANIHRVLHHAEEARRIADEVAAELTARHLDGTTAYATVIALSARLAHDRHRYADAIPLGLAAADLMREIAGHDTMTVVEVLSYVSASHTAMGDYAQARSTTQRCHDALLALGHPAAAAAAIGLAHVDYLAGDGAALPRMQRLVADYDAESRARTGQPPPLAMSGRFDLADDLLASGAADALPLVRDLVASLDLAAWQRGTGEHDWPARFEALQGRLAVLEGDKTRARRQLEPAIAAMIEAKSPRHQIERAQRALAATE